ncbi:MAG: Ger(x)C family spore germination protein [Marinisporobacter sp.]|jgi:spore germination protein KC|nr:Ger(x)C family spore germination protein [Marinisporobacter sp.]
MKKKILLAMLLFWVSIFSGCWNYSEINDFSIAVGTGVDYDKKRDKLLLTTEVVYPMVTNGETKLEAQIIKSEGQNFFDAIRNIIQITGKKVFWAHAKVFVIGEEVAKNKKALITLLDMIKRDENFRDDIYIMLSKEKSAGDIFETDVLVQDIVTFQMNDIIKNKKGVEKYYPVQLWKFVDDLASEGISPTLPTVRATEFKNKKVLEVYGTEVFKGIRPVGWLNGEETKTFLMIIDELEGSLLNIEKKDQKIGLEIFKNKTKVDPIYENEKITMKMDVRTVLNISELESETDFISEKGRNLVKKEVESVIEKRIKTLIEKVQNQYASDIFGFGNYVERKYPEYWKIHKQNWNEIFKNLNIEVKSEVNIRGSALRSKPVKVGD